MIVAIVARAVGVQELLVYRVAVLIWVSGRSYSLLAIVFWTAVYAGRWVQWVTLPACYYASPEHVQLTSSRRHLLVVQSGAMATCDDLLRP